MSRMSLICRRFSLLVPTILLGVWSSFAQADHGGSTHANYGLSVPANSTDGSYTLTWYTNIPYLRLEEKVSGGTYTPVQPFTGVEAASGEYAFVDKAPNSYTYRLKFQFCYFTCTINYTLPQTIIVTDGSANPIPVMGFDDNYSAVGGDLDGDGDKDVFVKYSPGSPIPEENASETVLVNNGDGSFELRDFASLTSAQRTAVNSWQSVVGSLKVSDFNADGAYDLYLDLPTSNFVTPIDDVIIYAATDAPEPQAQSRVDTEFVEFFDQLDNWAQNENYFEENAPTITESLPETTGTGWYYFATSNGGLTAALIACALDHGISNCTYYIGFLGDVFSLTDCISLASQGISCDQFGAHVFGFSLTTVFVDVEVPDYSVFNQDALTLAKGGLKEAIAANGIEAGSLEAIEIADLLESILNVAIYGGVFRDSNVTLPDEVDVDEDVNEARRLRWLLDWLLLILSYLSEEGSPDDGTAQISAPILLTFDDGPQPTSALTGVVAALAIEGVLADFYVIGQEVQAKPAETAALIPIGHRVQNHSWSHPGQSGTTPLTRQTQAQVNAEISDAQTAIVSATGVAPTRFRAPFGIGGAWNNVDPKIQAAADMYNLDVIFWDVDTEDWKNDNQGLNGRTIPASVLSAKAFALTRPNISRVNILMHVQSSTAIGLVPFIEALELVGFSFTVPPP